MYVAIVARVSRLTSCKSLLACEVAVCTPKWICETRRMKMAKAGIKNNSVWMPAKPMGKSHQNSAEGQSSRRMIGICRHPLEDQLRVAMTSI